MYRFFLSPVSNDSSDDPTFQDCARISSSFPFVYDSFHFVHLFVILRFLCELVRFHIGADRSSRQFVKADETVGVASATSRWYTVSCALPSYSTVAGLPSGKVCATKKGRGGFLDLVPSAVDFICLEPLEILGKRLVSCIQKACCCMQIARSGVVWIAAIAAKICSRNRFRLQTET